MHGVLFLNRCHTSRKGYIENDLYFNCLMRHQFMKYFHHINISLNALRYFVYEWCHSWRLLSKFRRSIFGFKIYGCRMNRFSFSTQEILNFKRYWCCIPRTSQIRKCNILFILKCGVKNTRKWFIETMSSYDLTGLKVLKEFKMFTQTFLTLCFI